MAEQKFEDLSNLEHSYDNFTPSVVVYDGTPSFPQKPSAPPVFGMPPPPPQYSPQVPYIVQSSIGEQPTQMQMAQDAAGHSRLRELANTMYQSSTCAIVLSCFVFWCCGWVLGLAAFILAVISRNSAYDGNLGNARQFLRASYVVSIVGIVIGIIIIIVIASVFSRRTRVIRYNTQFNYNNINIDDGNFYE